MPRDDGGRRPARRGTRTAAGRIIVRAMSSGAARLDVRDLDVALPVDLDARRELALGQDAELREQLLGLGRRQRRQRVDGRPVVRQAAARGLGMPLLGVAVALEQDLLVVLDDRRQDRRSGPSKSPGLSLSSSSASCLSESATAVLRTVCGQ